MRSGRSPRACNHGRGSGQKERSTTSSDSRKCGRQEPRPSPHENVSVDQLRLTFTESGKKITKGCSSTRAGRVNEQPLFHVIGILTGRIGRSLPQGRSGPTAKRQYARFFINTIAAPAASTAITAIIVTETSPVTGRGSVTGCGSSVTGCTAAFKETFAGLGTK